MRKRFKNVFKAMAIFLTITYVGASLLSRIEGIPFGESLYRTFLLITTVAEYPAVTPQGQILSGVLLLSGLGVLLYMVILINKILIEIDVKRIMSLEMFRKKEDELIKKKLRKNKK